MKRVSKKAQYQYMIDNVNDAVYTVRLADNSFTSLNPAGERMTGYKRKEFLKLKFAQLVVPEYLGLVQQMIQQKAKDDQSTIYEIEIFKKDGTKLPVEISSRAAYKNGKPHEILGVARDITERKHLEKQKEIFFSLITHELKNPLTTIRAYVDLLERLKKEKAENKSSKYIEEIKSQLDAVSVLMDDFLEVSKIRVGKFTIEKKSFSLDDVVRETVTMFRKTHKQHEFTLTGTAGKLVGDKARIKQVMTNLLSNAIKYSPKEKKIIISLEKKKKMIQASVQDFGVGIQKKDLQQIFELFYRTEHAERNIHGHGLGLYICKEIIQSHKGKIWVESEPGKGSIFYFTLPLGPAL